MKMSLLVVAIIIGLQGCASINTMPVGKKLYEMKSEDCQLDVMSFPPNDKKYEEVCMVTMRSGLLTKQVTNLLPKIKQTACACGADAIVIKSARQGGWSLDLGANRAEMIIGAIRYVEK